MPRWLPPSVRQQVVFEIVYVHLRVLKTNIQQCVSEEELHAVGTEVCVQRLMCVCVCVACIPAVREHDQRAAEAVRLRGAIPAGAGWVSAGGHCHGDPTLPRQPASCSGLLSSGIVRYWFRPVQSSLVSHDVIQHCKHTQTRLFTKGKVKFRQFHPIRKLIFISSCAKKYFISLFLKIDCKNNTHTLEYYW